MRVSNPPKLRTQGALLAVAALLVMPAPACPDDIHVDLFQSRQPIAELRVSAPVELLIPQHRLFTRPLVLRAQDSQVTLSTDGRGGAAMVERAPRVVLSGPGKRTNLSLPDGTKRSYRGTIEVKARGKHLAICNAVDKRDYIYSVVSGETAPDFAVEELKAQSVLAQTLIVRMQRGEHIPDTTDRQVYGGAAIVRPAVKAAVDSTWERILTFRGAPVVPYFHSTCAGGTSDGAQYFHLAGDLPYLHGIACTYCRNSPFWKSKRVEIPLAAWQARMRCGVPDIASKDQRNRPLTVEVDGRKLTGYEMWMKVGQRLGWDKMPGTRYEIATVANRTVRLTSTGAGHGVGLCQWGANGMARAGKSYLQILDYYFPGTKVQPAHTAPEKQDR